eukprot:13981-Pleurochrysis_carterae.AAC.1
MESSGSGRPEWGTWCDTELFAAAREAINQLVFGPADGAWNAMWQLAADASAEVADEALSDTASEAAGTARSERADIEGSESVGGATGEENSEAAATASTAVLRVAGGAHWDCVLRLFAPTKSSSERVCSVKHADGVLTLVRPLAGSVVISKLRFGSGAVLGKPREMHAGADALLQARCRDGGRGSTSSSLRVGGELEREGEGRVTLEVSIRRGAKERFTCGLGWPWKGQRRRFLSV